MRTASGPIPPNAWLQPAQVVAHLTEHPIQGDPLANAGRRCGPANVIASALMQGADVLTGFVGRFRSAWTLEKRVAPLVKELLFIEESLRRRTVSYEQLSRLQDLLYGAENAETETEHVFRMALQSSSDADSAALLRFQQRLRAHELLSEDIPVLEAVLSRCFGGEQVWVREGSASPAFGLKASHTVSVVLHPSTGAPGQARPSDVDVQRVLEWGGIGVRRLELVLGPAPLPTLLSAIGVGESACVPIGLDERAAEANHFITLGRNAQGVAFIYNSAPVHGDFTLYCGDPGAEQPADFEAQMHRYARRLSRDPSGAAPWVTVADWKP